MNRTLILLAAMALLPAAARAETVGDAIASALATSPLLSGQQNTARGIAEGAVQARAGWQPQVSIAAAAAYQREPYDSINYGQGSVETNDTQASLNLTQPIYTGGKVSAQVRAADARTAAGQQGVRATETQLIQSVVGAYMDVLRDSTIMEIRRADLDTLRRQSGDTRARYKLGDAVTGTDVAQADTQQQAAVVALSQAQAQLDTSRAEYLAVVGDDAGDLAAPDQLPGLPGSLAEALRRAKQANPTLVQSEDTARASDADIDTARAADMPNVSVQASFGTIGPASPFHTGQYQQAASAMITVTQPIYTGGLVASQIRQAEDQHDADRDTAANTARQAAQAARGAWSNAQNGEDAIAAAKLAVTAAQTALRGAQAEYQYGLRSTLDVLIADENLRAAQVALAQSEHDTIVAEAALLAATGDLDERTTLAHGW